MVEISNSDRDKAVRLLQALADTLASDDRTRVINLCRLARKLAKQLAKKPKK